MWDPIGMMYILIYGYDPDIDAMLVFNNIGQGSSGYGFVFPFVECEKSEKYGFYNNEVSGALNAIAFAGPYDHCYYGGK